VRRPTGGVLLRLGLLAVAGYYAVWGGEYSVFGLRELERQLAAEQLRLESVRQQTDSLRVVAERIESDPLAIERVARERFGMIRHGETLVRFVVVED
jgi:cell division protein FtsB